MAGFTILRDNQVVWQTPQTPSGRAQALSDLWEAYQQTPMGQANQLAEDEGRTRFQAIQDRDYQLQLDQLKAQRDRDAAQIGYQRANLKYQQAALELSREKMRQDAQQFNVVQSGYLDSGSPTLNRQQFEAGTTGYYQGAPTLAREQWAENALRGWAGLASSLRGPGDYAQYKALTSGVANGLGSIPGLNWTTGSKVGNAAMAGPAPVASVQRLFSDLGVGPSSGMAPGGQINAAGNAVTDAGGGGGLNTLWSGGLPQNLSEQDRQIYQTANEFASNPHLAAPGWFERQGPTSQAMLRSAAEAQGHDWNTVLSRFGMSRWGASPGARAA